MPINMNKSNNFLCLTLSFVSLFGLVGCAKKEEPTIINPELENKSNTMITRTTCTVDIPKFGTGEYHFISDDNHPNELREVIITLDFNNQDNKEENIKYKDIKKDYENYFYKTKKELKEYDWISMYLKYSDKQEKIMLTIDFNLAQYQLINPDLNPTIDTEDKKNTSPNECEVFKKFNLVDYYNTDKKMFIMPNNKVIKINNQEAICKSSQIDMENFTKQLQAESEKIKYK